MVWLVPSDDPNGLKRCQARLPISRKPKRAGWHSGVQVERKTLSGGIAETQCSARPSVGTERRDRLLTLARVVSGNAVAYQSKGDILYTLQRYEEALAAYDRTLQLDPTLISVHFLKGETLYHLKRYKEAVAAYDQVLHLDPNHVEAFFKKAMSLGFLYRFAEALVACDHALSLAPTN